MASAWHVSADFLIFKIYTHNTNPKAEWHNSLMTILALLLCSQREMLHSGSPGAKTINVFRACLGAQLTICAQKWRNFVLFSTVSLRFVFSRVCVFLYSLGPRTFIHVKSAKRFHLVIWIAINIPKNGLLAGLGCGFHRHPNITIWSTQKTPLIYVKRAKDKNIANLFIGVTWVRNGRCKQFQAFKALSLTAHINVGTGR